MERMTTGMRAFIMKGNNHSWIFIPQSILTNMGFE